MHEHLAWLLLSTGMQSANGDLFMSLQLRLMAGVIGLFCLLVLLGWLGLRGLTGTLREALGESASEVGRAVVTVLRTVESERLTAPSEGAAEVRAHLDSSASSEVLKRRDLRLVVNGRVIDADAIQALDPDTLPAPLARLLAEAAPLRFTPLPGAEELTLSLQGLGPDRRIVVPTSPVARALAGFSERLAWGLAALLLVGALGAWLLARHLGAPLSALAHAAARVGEGRLGEQVPLRGPPEVRASLQAFNRMSVDLARLQAQADRQREDRALAELGEIGRGLAHSLRNPLHALGLGLDALATGTGDAQALVAASRAQLDRIDQALRAFLALSTAAGARAEDVDLAALVDDVLLEASQRAQGRVRLERALPPLRLSGVPAELRILLHTLVMNAVEASPQDGVVRIHAAVCDDGIELQVEDEGPGLGPEVRARLFQPHVSTKPAGAGMGLYLSERLARQRYGGGILLEDRSPQGTLARLRLRPRAEEEATDAG